MQVVQVVPEILLFRYSGTAGVSHDFFRALLGESHYSYALPLPRKVLTWF